MITIFSFRNPLLIIMLPQPNIRIKVKQIKLTGLAFKELIWLKDITEWLLSIKLISNLVEVLEIMHNKLHDRLRKDKDRVSKSCTTWTPRECLRSLITNQLQVMSVSSWTPTINRSLKKKWEENLNKITITQLLIWMPQAF